MSTYREEDYNDDVGALEQASIPILSFDFARKQFFVRGTGFLVFIKDNYFVITASHVIQSAANTGTGIQPIVGRR